MVIDKVSKKLTDSWTNPQEITKDQWEVYDYGLQILLTYMVILVLIGVMSLLFGQFGLTLLYLLGFLLTRYISGGFHAKDDVRCIGLTMAVCAAFNLLARYTQSWPVAWLIGLDTAAFCISAIIIWCLAPVDYADRFDSEDHLRHKKQGRKMIMFYALILLVGCLPVLTRAASAVLWGYLTAAISVYIGHSHIMKGGESNE